MPRLAAWLLAAAALAGPGCASFSAYRARAAHVRAGLEAYRYTVPEAVVWAAVQQLLADRGLALAGTDAAAVGQKHGVMARFSSAAKETRATASGGLLLETAWNEDGVRWRAESTPGPGGLRVVLTRIEMNREEFGSDGVTLRDFELELDLLRRVDPQAAERLEDPSTPIPAPPRAYPPPSPPLVPAVPATRSPGPPGP